MPLPFSARLYAFSSPVCVKHYVHVLRNVHVLHFARICIDNVHNLNVSLPSLVRCNVIPVNTRGGCVDTSVSLMLSEWLAHEHSCLRRAHELALNDHE